MASHVDGPGPDISATPGAAPPGARPPAGHDTAPARSTGTPAPAPAPTPATQPAPSSTAPSNTAPAASAPATATAPSSTPPSSGSRRSRRTTQQLLTRGVCAALAVLAVLSVVGMVFFARATSVSDDLLDRTTPALVNSANLESALINQETGIRGYGLSGQRDFLQPYTEGATQERQAVAQLHWLLPAGSPASRDLTAVLKVADHWQDRIARPIAAEPAGAPAPLATQRADEGRKDFDAVRAALTVQQTRLRAQQVSTRAELNHIDTERDVVFVVIAGVVLLLAVLIFVGLRRVVTGPLDRLSQDVRRVSRGDFNHPVEGAGPADLRRLASDVNTMRERLAAELVFTNRARDQLDEQAADLRRSNAELEQFAYVASHDLQEPLRKVASFCQLLERRYAAQLDDRARTYIGFAVDGANRMQGLINDLLEFSRVGRLHAEHGPVDLEEVLTRVEDSLSIAIEESGADVRHDPLPTVTGDRTQLSMLMQNLLSNAIKFRSPDRPPRLDVTVVRRGPVWEIAVADNGIGIEQAYAEKVFVIFQRLHTRETYPGNGIGLALCKKIVEYHGGTITLDPDHGPGARLVLTLPVMDDAPPAADDEPLAPAGAEAAGERA
ncbi:CHASE3 domain-containing protein [Streptomyces sp. SL13]|uniref:histidine kinase n=1 Tax=Streptantibioticus silvisoli TaxID=2705255 RepID=A0AA90H4J7_9ACTN|nr:sensor histidine kinase [Streptantibioticus silvisoli]MDI5971131.1 CHASE3 domain-containing protein [Streptantibioticus silvisoli]